MLENYLIRGLLIGLIFGVPAGAIGALTIQRTLNGGFSAGLTTGLGSSAADLLYACAETDFELSLNFSFTLYSCAAISQNGRSMGDRAGRVGISCIQIHSKLAWIFAQYKYLLFCGLLIIYL